jgi:hypothetical protein
MSFVRDKEGGERRVEAKRTVVQKTSAKRLHKRSLQYFLCFTSENTEADES